jgi:hypothetical protein
MKLFHPGHEFKDPPQGEGWKSSGKYIRMCVPRTVLILLIHSLIREPKSDLPAFVLVALVQRTTHPVATQNTTRETGLCPPKEEAERTKPQ